MKSKGNNVKVVLLTTSVLTNNSVIHLNRLHNSIINNLVNDFTIEHILLLQNPNMLELPKFKSSEKYNITILTEPTMISLSEARNRMLKFSKDNNIIDRDDLIAFPDDDCWYPEQNLVFIWTKFNQNPTLDFFFCKYRDSNHEEPIASKIKYKVNTKTLVQNASSNTIFIRGYVVNELQGFDRQLGVGAKNNGGEDLDYAIRSYLKAKNTGFLDRFMIGHRNKDTSLRGKYFRGSAIVLNRYKFCSLGLFIQFCRKGLVGLFLLSKKELSVSEFIKSFRFVKVDSKL